MKIGNWIKDIIINIKRSITEKIKKLRQKMKLFFTELGSCFYTNKRTFIKSGLILFSSLIFLLVLNLISFSVIKNVPDQNSCLEWGGKDYAQVSCYTSRADGFHTDELMRFEYEMNKMLKTSEKENVSKWTDAYSGKGKLTVTNGNTSVEGVAYGVGNNFFFFHPLQLLNGSYIDTKNVMKDYILLDEEAAWRLFGSSDIAGMYAYINGEPHVIAGVYKQPKSWPNKAAGNGEITFYVSYEVLKKYNEDAAITCYEVIMENAVKHYAYRYVQNYFQPEAENTDGAAKVDLGLSDKDSDREIKIIETSDRYSVQNRWKELKNFGVHSMKLDEIIYPFWENIAIAYGTVLTLLFFFQIVEWITVVLCIVIMIIKIHRFR